MAKVLEIRPISVTENLQHNSLSRGAKLFWMIGTLIQMLSLTIFSLRVDRIWDKNYLLNHWKHYSGEKLRSYVTYLDTFVQDTYLSWLVLSDFINLKFFSL